MPAKVHPQPLVIRPVDDLLEKYPALPHMSRDLAHAYAFHRFATEEALQAVGSALWRALDVAAELDAARQQAGADILPLVIESGVPAIQQLPWETLHHPQHGFLAKAAGFTLSRRIPDGGGAAAAPEPGPLRVLLFTALPDDLDAEQSRLDVEEEQAQIQEALTPAVAQGLVVLQMPDDGRFSTLQERLAEFQPHLVFLSGHGKYFDLPHQDEAAYAVFQFEDDHGHSDFVRGEKLAQAFYGRGVVCVVLSACESGMGASAELAQGLAWRLNRMGIPHVIGMRESVLNRAGILFNRAFVDALKNQERVDVALQAGRQAIQKPLKDSLRLMAGSELAELSLAQWCLPLLLSAEPGRPLLEWAFTPQPPESRDTQQMLDTVALPPRFIGRRSELRAIKSRIRQGELAQLLITGPGGQGKTALAGKIAGDLAGQGYEIFAYAARPESIWRQFFLQLFRALSPPNRQDYTSLEPHLETEQEKAGHMLDLLGRQFPRLVLFLDNLETVQDPQTLALTDARLAAWIAAAQARSGRGTALLLTSRWRLPGWPEADHQPLAHASYGDFLQMAERELPRAYLQDRDRLRRVYATLHGNGRGLTFFAAAIREMDSAAEEEEFLARLAVAEQAVQADMALERIYAHLPAEAQTLLARLPAYRVPVPIEGMIKLGLDLPAVDALLQRLLAVSLVEPQDAPRWRTVEYQVPPLVGEWLVGQGVPLPDQALRRQAAEYLAYLYRNERPTLVQAIIVHQAMHAAGETEEAHRFALGNIVKPLSRAGLYQTLLDEWLPDICQAEDVRVRASALTETGNQHHYLSNYQPALNYLEQALEIYREIGDKAGEGTTLNNISQIFKARGDYATALAYLEQSLQIRQEIGDKAGEGTTLNNISQIFKARGDYATALAYLGQSLQISQEIGDKAGEGTTLNNMATTAYARGDYATALAYLGQSLQISQEIGDKAGEGTTLNNISQIFKARGDYATALAYLERVLEIMQEIGDKAKEGGTLNNMATTAYARGDYATALAYLEQSLQISQEIGDKAGEGTTLNNISQIFKARGDYATALAYLGQSLQIRQEIGDKAGEGTTLNNISQIYAARGDYATALAYLEQSLQISQEIGDASGLCVTLFNIGHIHAQNEEIQEAFSAWVTAYRLASKMNLAQILQALADLAPQVGLAGGLAGWAQLAQQMDTTTE